MRGYVGQGRFTDDPLDTFGGAGVVEIPQMQKLLRYHLRKRFRAPCRRQSFDGRRRRPRSDHPLSRLGHVLARPVHNGDTAWPLWLELISERSVFASPLLTAIAACLDPAMAEYPLHRKRDDPEYATQSPRRPHARARCGHPRSGEEGWHPRRQVKRSLSTPPGPRHPGRRRSQATRTNTTSGAIIAPKAEAAEITEAAHREGLEAIQWCGGVYSSEWGFSKLLHWLRHNPDKRAAFVSAFEHCDMVAATLCGITDPDEGEAQRLRDGTQMALEPQLGGLPPESFLTKVDPLLAGVREKLDGRLRHLRPDRGKLSPTGPSSLG